MTTLTGVADVVELPSPDMRLGVGKPIAGGIGVLHPEKAPVADHKIGIVVEAEERSDRAHPLLDVPMEQDPALVGDVAAEQDVGIAEIPGEQSCVAPGPADGDTVRARRRCA